MLEFEAVRRGGVGTENFVETLGGVGVGGVLALGGCGGFVSPLFVAPEPEFGVAGDHGFHDIPAGLGDLLVGGVGGGGGASGSW